MILRRIISGGQTGADRAGLEVARELGLETGGWAPKGYLTENGLDPSLADFGLREHPSPLYPPRTEANIQEADGTVIFGSSPLDGGTLLTVELAGRCNQPHLVNPTPDELRRWLNAQPIQTLNVAGNRASQNPGIAALVKATIRDALASTSNQ